MHRFYLPPGSDPGTTLLLSGREAHHALHVLRVRAGEKVQVLDGEGLVRECQVSESGRDQVVLKILEKRQIPPLPRQITLAQAIPKGKLFESILQKATELGAARIVPLLTQRTIVRLDEAEDDRKLEKWRLVVIEAVKQCGSAWLPRVEAPMTIEQFLLKSSPAELPLVGSLRENAQHPRIHFDAFEHKNGRKPKSVSVAIGPEGDFTDEELSALQSAGAHPITLGPLVLRTETAAAYCLSVINYEVQWAKS
jgi:16S rRNA (uracil1498-N3)-methyltransferase